MCGVLFDIRDNDAILIHECGHLIEMKLSFLFANNIIWKHKHSHSIRKVNQCMVYQHTHIHTSHTAPVAA